ncbi:hypothetical protein ANN_17241 [Periplaneta americana]|uniref:Uncharacterized protein n=1 Tax=Periplaneta americana TaxID=6978 RepID=A0ABQ8STL0_PERAM|nr:hypothetical protein ANN_17241 [Periplaneta americana]
MAGLCEVGNEPPGSLKASTILREFDPRPRNDEICWEQADFADDFSSLCYTNALWLSNMVYEKLRQMVNVCQRKMERKIMQVTLKDLIRNVDLGKNTDMKDAVQVADELKWNWGGHVTRMPDTQWTFRVTMWDPRIGKRSAGRQKIRWADTFTQRAGKQWTRRARSRSTWKKLSKETSIGGK